MAMSKPTGDGKSEPQRTVTDIQGEEVSGDGPDGSVNTSERASPSPLSGNGTAPGRKPLFRS